jgi:hypothetical protein
MGREKRFVVGDTIEEKFDSIERVLWRISRRSNKVATGIVTPFPVSSYVEDPTDGVVFRYMFPLEGEIIKAYIVIDKFPKKGVNLIAELRNRGTGVSKQETMLRTPFVSGYDMHVVAGSCLTISVEPVEKEETVGGIWLGIAWAPKVNEAVLKEFLLDELEKADASQEEG